VLSVRTAAEALEFLRDAAAEKNPFQVAVVDLSARELGDLALMQAIKADAQLGGLRMVGLSALGNRLEPAVMQEARISACLTKPIRVSRLYDCLARVLSGHGDDTKFFAAEAFGEVLPYYAAAKRNIRILLAEDNTVNQRLALRQLKKLGYNADAVANGREVLEALQRVPYDVILMDCQMPEVDGYEAARRIRQGARGGAPYIIALTANALVGDRNRCLSAGMNDYLPKPLDLPGLEGVLQRALLKLQRQVRPEDSEGEECLDPAVIAGLKELRQPGEPDPLRELAELFVKDSRPRLARMEEAIAGKERLGLASAGHTLKGSANNLGARHLAGLCGGLEKAGTEGDFAEAANILLELKREFQRVERALKAELEKLPQA
jgi:CheY-like chemotaxis protein/HPt (histidine-containing phosphotransfer) domain-containing protein